MLSQAVIYDRSMNKKQSSFFRMVILLCSDTATFFLQGHHVLKVLTIFLIIVILKLKRNSLKSVDEAKNII